MTTLILYALAVWRATSMIIQEDGPGYIFARIRHWAGADKIGELSSFAVGIKCPYCVSFWVALTLVVGMRTLPNITRTVALVLGLSAGAILTHGLTERLKQ